MKFLISSSTAILGLAIISLMSCSQADTNTAPTVVETVTNKPVKKASGFDYVSMEGFSYDMAKLN